MLGGGNRRQSLEGADDLGSRVGQSAAASGGSQDLLWWIAIPVAVAIGIGVFIRKISGNRINMSSLNEDDSHNVPFYPVDLLETEADIFSADVW